MYDRFGRSIEYLRISVTDRCNLRCRYCMDEEGIPLLPKEQILSYEAIIQIARMACSLGFTKIRLTGGEPLVRSNLVYLVRELARIPGLKTLALTTNGTLLADQAAALKAAGLQKVNVSLDTLDPAFFRWLTRGGDLAEVFEGLRAAQKVSLPIKINTVVLSSSLLTAGKAAGTAGEQDIEQVLAFASSIGAEHQCIAQYRLGDLKTEGPYERPPPCENCNRLRLLANGTLRPCLHSDLAVPINMNDIEGSFQQALRIKPYRGDRCLPQNLTQIGG